jgi:hypothetical protein
MSIHGVVTLFCCRCNGSAIVECETRDSAPNRTDRTPLCSCSPHVFFSFPSSSLTSRIPILVLVRLFSPSTFPDRSQTIPIYDKADVPSFSLSNHHPFVFNVAHISTFDRLNLRLAFKSRWTGLCRAPCIGHGTCRYDHKRHNSICLGYSSNP